MGEAVLASGRAGKSDRRPPVRQRLRHAFVGRPQVGALPQQLRVVVIGVGERLGKRLRRRRCPGKQQQRRRDAYDATRPAPRRPVASAAPPRQRHPPPQNTKAGFATKLGSSGVAASNITRDASPPPARVIKVARPTHSCGRRTTAIRPPSASWLLISSGIAGTAPANRIKS